jgi:pimeloyl-ACP methyl ester carboxylesterase
MTQPAWTDIRYTARDGLRLYARHYPAPHSNRRSVICLPGLTRNARDFHTLALALSQAPDSPREVYALDYRGRGQSDYATDGKTYNVFTELNDVLDFMTLAGLGNAAVVGTSRGGILAMIMGAVRPATIGAVILNDIGPVIDLPGLVRIAGYVGRVPVPLNWPEAAEIVKGMNAALFPKVSDAEWAELAQQWFEDKGGRPAQGYDPKLAQVLSLNQPIPNLWPQFLSLKHVPVMAIRGANSDLLSPKTLDEMARRHPNITTLTVADQGHAPLLRDAPTISAISDFLVRCEAQKSLHASASDTAAITPS